MNECGNIRTVLTCPTGRMPILQHNELRDMTATLMTEVCHNVCTEPGLQPLSVLHGQLANCQEGARVDIRVKILQSFPLMYGFIM